MDQKEIISAIIGQWGGTPAGVLGARIAANVFKRDENERKFITYTSLIEIAQKEKIDEELLAAINILTSSSYAILEPKGLFVDDDGNEFDLSNKEIGQFLSTGLLIHPNSGEEVKSGAEQIIPYFIYIDQN